MLSKDLEKHRWEKQRLREIETKREGEKLRERKMDVSQLIFSKGQCGDFT